MMTFQLLQSLNSNIFEELGLTNLTEDKKKLILERLETVISDKILLRIVDELTEENRKHFLELLQAEDGAQALKFAEERIENLIDLIEEEVAEVKLQLVSKVNSNVSEAIVLSEIADKGI